jgi:hypothetical protein
MRRNNIMSVRKRSREEDIAGKQIRDENLRDVAERRLEVRRDWENDQRRTQQSKGRIPTTEINEQTRAKEAFGDTGVWTSRRRKTEGERNN